MLKLWDMASLKTSQVIQNANYNILVNVMKIGWLLLKIVTNNYDVTVKSMRKMLVTSPVNLSSCTLWSIHNTALLTGFPCKGKKTPWQQNDF